MEAHPVGDGAVGVLDYDVPTRVVGRRRGDGHGSTSIDEISSLSQRYLTSHGRSAHERKPILGSLNSDNSSPAVVDGVDDRHEVGHLRGRRNGSDLRPVLAVIAHDVLQQLRHLWRVGLCHGLTSFPSVAY